LPPVQEMNAKSPEYNAGMLTTTSRCSNTQTHTHTHTHLMKHGGDSLQCNICWPTETRDVP